MKKKLFHNIMILIIAPLLALVFFYFFQNSGQYFLASVLDLEEVQLVEEKGRGLAYKTTDNMIEIFGSKLAQDFSILHFEILYDSENIYISTGDFLGTGLTLLSSHPGSLYLAASNDNNKNIDQERFTLFFSGEKSGILLGEAYGLDVGGKKHSLAVGNLNPNDVHSILF